MDLDPLVLKHSCYPSTGTADATMNKIEYAAHNSDNQTAIMTRKGQQSFNGLIRITANKTYFMM